MVFDESGTAQSTYYNVLIGKSQYISGHSLSLIGRFRTQETKIVWSNFEEDLDRPFIIIDTQGFKGRITYIFYVNYFHIKVQKGNILNIKI